MISANHVAAGVYGAWRLALRDPSGMRWFDDSVEGFWRSFFAAVLVLPFFAFMAWAGYDQPGVTAAPARYVSAQAIGYVVSWVTFPLVMAGVTRLLEVEGRYVRFVVAYNWAAVIQNAAFFPVALVAEAGLAGSQAAAFLELAVLTLVLVYLWFVARTALEVPGPAAAGIVGLDLILSIFIHAVTSGLASSPGLQ